MITQTALHGPAEEALGRYWNEAEKESSPESAKRKKAASELRSLAGRLNHAMLSLANSLESTDKGDLVMVPKIFGKGTQLEHLMDMDAAERYTVLHLNFHVHRFRHNGQHQVKQSHSSPINCRIQNTVVPASIARWSTVFCLYCTVFYN